MNKETALALINMTEQQVLKTAAKMNLNLKESEVLEKGKEFIDKFNELENQELRNNVILKLIAYGLIKTNEKN